MAGKGRQTFEKRRLDKLRQEQQEAKRERRHAKKDEEAASGPENEDQLYERFRLLNEAKAEGKIDDEAFRIAEHEILVALGVKDDEDPEA